MVYKRGEIISKRYVDLCFARSLILPESEKRKIWIHVSQWCFDVILKQKDKQLVAADSDKKTFADIIINKKIFVDIIDKWLQLYNPLINNFDPIQNCFEGALVEYFQELYDSFAIHAMRQLSNCRESSLKKSIVYQLENDEETKYAFLLRYYINLQFEKNILVKTKTAIGSIGFFPTSFRNGLEYKSIQHYIAQRIECIHSVFGFQPALSTTHCRLFDQLAFETDTPERFLWEEKNKAKLETLEKTIDTIVSISSNKNNDIGEQKAIRQIFASKYNNVFIRC